MILKLYLIIGLLVAAYAYEYTIKTSDEKYPVWAWLFVLPVVTYTWPYWVIEEIRERIQKRRSKKD